MSIFSIGRAENIKESTTLFEIFEKNTILAMNYWNINDETFLCLVTFHTRKEENINIPYRRLTFYKKINKNFIKIHEFETADNFLSMYFLSDYNGNLMTIWISGSAYHFYVFSLIDKKIKLVLESGSKLTPEIVDIDNDGKYEILVTDGAFLIDSDTKKVISYPESTNIYKWDGKSYKLIQIVHWKNRLNALKAEE